MRDVDAARDRAARRVGTAVAALDGLVDRFASAGHELALVGGSVRDAFLDRELDDIDLTTSARPDEVLGLVRGWADAVWETGVAFGTVGVARQGHRIEITTYRAESYDPGSRKPEVSYGDSLHGDLARRDFRVNAMAVSLPGMRFVDPFDGLSDLVDRTLHTPGRPEDSFSDDPLRMLRAARFAAQLGFEVSDEVVEAMRGMAGRIAIVSAERVRDELTKLLLGEFPTRGLRLVVDTGLADHVLPELPALRLEIDEHHRHKDVYEHTLTVVEQAIGLAKRRGPIGDQQAELVLRLSALMHDVGKPRTRRFEDGGGVSFHHHEVVGAKITRARLAALKFPKHVVEDVTELVELHLRFHGYGGGTWTDSAVRRYVRDAGPLLEHLHRLTRADCTTRNRRKAAALAGRYDDLEARIARLAEQEELDSIRPDLDGTTIMALLGIQPGPAVGHAYKHLLELRMEHGPLGAERAEAELRAWAAANPDLLVAPVRRSARPSA